MEKTYAEYVAQADLYKQIGLTQIHIADINRATIDSVPWEHVTEVKASGLGRLRINVGLWFTAVDPCGLTFTWSYEAEPRSATGSPLDELDVEGVAIIARRIPPPVRASLTQYVQEAAEVVKKQAEDYQQMARQEASLATALAELAMRIA